MICIYEAMGDHIDHLVRTDFDLGLTERSRSVSSYAIPNYLRFPQQNLLPNRTPGHCSLGGKEDSGQTELPTVVQAGSIASWKRIRLFILSFDGIFQSAALTDTFYHGRINLRSQSATTSYLTTKEQ